MRTSTGIRSIPRLRDDPYPLWKRLRDEAPLYRNDRYDFWVLSRFDDVEAAHKRPHHVQFGPHDDDRDDDPGAAHRHRDVHRPRPANAHRLPGAGVAGLHPRGVSPPSRRGSAPLPADLLDAQVGSGGFDYVQDFAAILPPTIISSLLGVPEADQEWMRHQVDDMFRTRGRRGNDEPDRDGGEGQRPALHRRRGPWLARRRPAMTCSRCWPKPTFLARRFPASSA